MGSRGGHAQQCGVSVERIALLIVDVVSRKDGIRGWVEQTASVAVDSVVREARPRPWNVSHSIHEKDFVNDLFDAEFPYFLNYPSNAFCDDNAAPPGTLDLENLRLAGTFCAAATAF